MSSWSEDPSARIVSARVVQAVAEWTRMNGRPLTRRGAGRPVLAADGLDEANLVLAHLGVGPQGLEGDTLEDEILRAELERGRADVAVAFVPVVDDLAVLDLDPGPEVFRLTEAVLVAQPREIAGADPVGRRLVVMADPHLEGDLGHALDCLRGDPGDGDYR